MGTHLSVLNESYPMNTNMTGFIDGFSWVSCVLLIWTKVAPALEGLIYKQTCKSVTVFGVIRHV